MTAVDRLSRYADTGALPSAAAEDIASFFTSNILVRHGAPAGLLSDRDRQFLSQALEATLKACNVVHKTTSSYHPHTNGLTGRFHRTLADILSMYITFDRKNWHTVLPFVTFAYNTAVQTTTGFISLQLVYGREPTCFVDTIFPYADDEGHDEFLMNFTSLVE